MNRLSLSTPIPLSCLFDPFFETHRQKACARALLAIACGRGRLREKAQRASAWWLLVIHIETNSCYRQTHKYSEHQCALNLQLSSESSYGKRLIFPGPCKCDAYARLYFLDRVAPQLYIYDT